MVSTTGLGGEVDKVGYIASSVSYVVEEASGNHRLYYIWQV